MREILFRAKRVDYGYWVEGYLVFNFWGRKEYTIHHKEKDNGGCCDVKEETIGQYTGLTDKNGRKIFEGDILLSAWNTRIVIYFDEDYLQFRAREISPTPRHNSIDYYDNNRMEIIGNIHDNPELLYE